MNAWRSLRHPVGLIPSLAKAKVVVDPLRADVQLRQLKALRAAYGKPDGPDVLVFGDSAMLWRSPSEPEKRSLAAMLADDLGAGVTSHFVLGNAYNPRLVRAFVTALERAPSRPRVVVVPTALMTTATVWLNHPDLGYETTAKALAELIAHGGRPPRKLPRPGTEEWERFDRSRAPSLIGERRTCGELRMMINAVPANVRQRPTTKWQHLVRMRHLQDFTNAEVLEPQSPGVHEVTAVAAQLEALSLASVAYISPVNHELIGKLLRVEVGAHLAANEQAVVDAYRGSHSRVVAGALISPEADFGDAIHLLGAGRAKLSGAIAAAVRDLLQ